MSWISGHCQNDRNWSCTYEDFDGNQWCVDSDSECESANDGGELISAQDNRHQGGGW